MKKVTAFIGTPRRRATYTAVREFEANLKRLAEVEFEYVLLDDYHLEYCQGCKLCLTRGEDLCPLKDDRDVLLEKMANSDGVVFATPNYAFQVSARMKNFLDRTAFIFHRPMFFGKTSTAIVTQGFGYGNPIRKYLEDTGENLGFRVTRGGCVTTLDPMTDRQRKKLSQEMRAAAERFYVGLMHPNPPPPSLFRLMIFRIARTRIMSLDQRFRDYHYWKEKGWFQSDYFYETPLGP